VLAGFLPAHVIVAAALVDPRPGKLSRFAELAKIERGHHGNASR